MQYILIRTQFKYLKTHKKCFKMIYTFTVNHTGSKVAIGALPGDDQVVPYVPESFFFVVLLHKLLNVRKI